MPRRGDYLDPALGEYASASAIRRALAAHDARAAAGVPKNVRACLAEADGGHGLDDVLLYRLRGLTAAELRALADVSEGLEGRLQRLCREAESRDALLEALRCRRYTQARLSRVLTQALIGLTRAAVEAAPLPPYARLLGLRREAGPLLRELKQRSRLPIVDDPTALRDDPVFQLECRAADAWALGRNAPAERRAGREFREKVVVV